MAINETHKTWLRIEMHRLHRNIQRKIRNKVSFHLIGDRRLTYEVSPTLKKKLRWNTSRRREVDSTLIWQLCPLFHALTAYPEFEVDLSLTATGP